MWFSLYNSKMYRTLVDDLGHLEVVQDSLSLGTKVQDSFRENFKGSHIFYPIVDNHCSWHLQYIVLLQLNNSDTAKLAGKIWIRIWNGKASLKLPISKLVKFVLGISTLPKPNKECSMACDSYRGILYLGRKIEFWQKMYWKWAITAGTIQVSLNSARALSSALALLNWFKIEAPFPTFDKFCAKLWHFEGSRVHPIYIASRSHWYWYAGNGIKDNRTNWSSSSPP